MPLLLLLAFLAVLLVPDGPLLAQENIVGTWKGDIVQGETTFPAVLTFVSPKGGVSRYPSFPCGGVLAGGPKGDGFQYSETVTWGTLEEKPDGCIDGVVSMAFDGDVLKYEWNGSHNGQPISAAGELRRVGGKPKKK
jgi:hypothetical protein